MTYHPIPAMQARAFIRQHISNPRIRAGLKWFMVSGVQYYPQGRRNLFLIADDGRRVARVKTADEAAGIVYQQEMSE